MIEYFIFLVGGYLIGSIPTAYLVVKARKGIDIRKKGSGNVGAYNVYDTTHSRLLGILVGLFDALKGFIATYCSWKLFGADVWMQILALIGTIVGHNYPVWLRFRGGRGLATAAGGYFTLGFSHIIVWCLIWAIAFPFSKKILRANLYAIILSPIIILLLPDSIIAATMVQNIDPLDFKLLVYIVSTLHILSHFDVIKKYFLPHKKKM